MENITVTVYDEETNMAAVMAEVGDRVNVRLFDVDSEQYVAGHLVSYPKHMLDQALQKAFSIAV